MKAAPWDEHDESRTGGLCKEGETANGWGVKWVDRWVGGEAGGDEI